MRARMVLTFVIAVVFVASFWAKAQLEARIADTSDLRARPETARRMISMAPSITETLYALDLDDRIVGVSTYCDYPPEALEKPKIGGYLNPNFEAVLSLDPDLVVLLTTAGRQSTAFEKLGLRTLRVDHRSVEGIMRSIELVGAACGAEQKADNILTDIRHRLDKIEQAVAGRPRPRVMIAIERSPGTGRLEDVYIAGCDGHIDRIIELAGGTNAYNQGTVRFPVVSREGILEMNPEVIVDLVSGLAGKSADDAAVRADWESLDQVAAVRSHRVHLVTDDYATVPGPRYILFVEKLARLIHREVEWSP